MKTAKRNRAKELCLLVSLLFIILFNYPLVLTFNRTITVLGLPLLILYLLGGWLLFIVVIFLIARRLGRNEHEPAAGGEEVPNRP